MKKIVSFLCFFSLLCSFVLAQLPFKKTFTENKTDSISQSNSQVKDSIAYRRPIPSLVTLNNSRCNAGVLKDFKPLAIYGAEAICFQPGGMHPAQFVVRIFLSADKNDRIEILIFDDVLRIRKKSYTIQANGPKDQPSIKVFVGDKPSTVLNKATLQLTMLVLRNNTFSLLVSEATKNENETSVFLPPTYDIAIHGIYILK